jgi:hypothetical protein
MVETHLLPDTQAFGEMIAGKIAQGYEVESQSDSEAVLVTRGRRRMFRPSLGGKRQHISINEHGRLSTRRL